MNLKTYRGVLKLLMLDILLLKFLTERLESSSFVQLEMIISRRKIHMSQFYFVVRL